jgi:hypothetical protein
VVLPILNELPPVRFLPSADFVPNVLRLVLGGEQPGNPVRLVKLVANCDNGDGQRDTDQRAYIVDNQAIVIPETIDAIRALTGREKDAQTSIARTNAALGIGAKLI